MATNRDGKNYQADVTYNTYGWSAQYNWRVAEGATAIPAQAIEIQVDPGNVSDKPNGSTYKVNGYNAT